MKMRFIIAIVLVLSGALASGAQDSPASAAGTGSGRLAAGKSSGDYASDVGVVLDAQHQAIEQARRALQENENLRDRSTLQDAIQAMQRSATALEQAKDSPEKLPAALAAEEAAYQALLKATPREYRMSRSRNRSRGGNSSGQPSQQEMNQLDLAKDDNRYETESQATAAQTPQQREQAQALDRLKQLARRQQDLNERLRDLQSALQQARTETERQELQRQLKRLRDEQRQLLADVDEMRQQMEQSPDAARQANARQQLEQTRTDMQRAAQELERQSASEALAAGSRAEQNLQDLRENMRQQTSSQFSQQMRQLRTQARDLANREEQIARDLEGLNNSARKSLDDSSQRKALADQMDRQQSALTNLLGQMRAVTEQAETAEPLLSKQLYDLLRRADQMHTENQLEIGGRLVDRGFLPQASEAERAARQNIDELRQGVERAAESVLGSEADALRYAQKELDDLARQIAGEAPGRTNSPAGSARGGPGNQSRTNAVARAGAQRSAQAGAGTGGTNELAGSEANGNAQAGQEPGEVQSASGQSAAREGEQGRAQAQANAGQGREQGNQQAGEPGNQPNQRQGQTQGQASPGQAVAQGERADGPGAGAVDRDQIRQFAEQLGGGRRGLGWNGPITGNSYMDWAERMRDVEQAVDSPDVRNQLATVRERVSVYRREFREQGRKPSTEELQNKVLAPLALARDWVGQELSRAQNDRSLVPLDRDPVQDKYSELVRKYYEELGGSR